MSGTYVRECITTQFAAIAGISVFPSDVKSGYTVIVVTGDTAISDEMLMYTDTSCSTPIRICGMSPAPLFRKEKN